MITDAFILIGYWAISALTLPLRLFSDVSLPEGITTAISTASGYISSIDFIVPVSTILSIFGVFLTFEVGVLTFKGINWLIRKIPTIS